MTRFDAIYNFNGQGNSTNHALLTYGVLTYYIAYIDVDEFLDACRGSVIPTPERPTWSFRGPLYLPLAEVGRAGGGEEW
eukprot:CAMPEP_0183333718 /NCGR_PEP_ID=MMETSP0164_2-20130417/2548_1 /TAXON_ID=221442 /ORGANISM="Coccolithus pelagicus ssp braarudi, Strain PLY182g" /LENGTH=78 /DNA_ID=CAMNT_0025502719 /DNA_START=153 /DNA_END=387 /DNA_ORIENTATION=-